MSILDKKLSKDSNARQSNDLQDVLSVMHNICDSKRPANFLDVTQGDPHESLFPWKSASFKLKDGTELEFTEKEMEKILQYGDSSGYPPLVKVLEKIQYQLHATGNNVLSCPDQWGVLPVAGAMEGCSKAFEMLIDEGDCYLLEVPCYGNILAALAPLGGRPISCGVDSQGVDPKTVHEKILLALEKGYPPPKLFYTCPTACNPAGLTTTAQRRREIYKLAVEFDFYIVEDDPYYFVHFDDDLFEHTPSYLSIDTEGRVIRIDSFSKVLSAGIRMGYVTAASDVIVRLSTHLLTTQMHISHIGQAMVAQLLDYWGFEKFIEYTRRVAAFYKKQMTAMVDAVDKHLSDVVEYSIPNGGLYLWLKFPAIKDTKTLVLERAASRNVMCVHGTAFQPHISEPDELSDCNFSQYIRIAYSLVAVNEMDSLFKRLRDAVNEEIGK